MAPYRIPSRQSVERAAPARDHDDLVVAGLLTIIGAIRVAIAVAGHERFGAEATIAAMMLVLGVIGLIWPRS
jgi:hypothetical protein